MDSNRTEGTMNLPADHPAIAQTLSFVRDTGLSARSAWAITTPVLHAAILHGTRVTYRRDQREELIMPLPYFPPANLRALYAAIAAEGRRFLEITR
jgi:hypothetical protein